MSAPLWGDDRAVLGGIVVGWFPIADLKLWPPDEANTPPAHAIAPTARVIAAFGYFVLCRTASTFGTVSFGETL